MPESAPSGTAPRVALLARAGKASENLADALRQAGAELVLAADPTGLDEQGLRAVGAQAVLVALEPGVEQALDRLDGVLSDPDMTVIFDEADIAAHRAGWDAARWVRHLTAKLHRHADVLPPGTEADQNWHPSPGQLPKPSAAFAHLDLTPFTEEALARADSVPADGIQIETPQPAREEPVAVHADAGAHAPFAGDALADDMSASLSLTPMSEEPAPPAIAVAAAPDTHALETDDVLSSLSLAPMSEEPATPAVAAVAIAAAPDMHALETDDVLSGLSLAPMSEEPTPPAVAAEIPAAPEPMADDAFAGLTLAPMSEEPVAPSPTRVVESVADASAPTATAAPDPFAGLSLAPLTDEPALDPHAFDQHTLDQPAPRLIDAMATESSELPAFDLDQFDTAGDRDADRLAADGDGDGDGDGDESIPPGIALESLLKIGRDAPESLPPLAEPEPEFSSFSVINVGDLRIEEHEVAPAPAAAPLSFDDDDFFLQELSLGREVPVAATSAADAVDPDEDFASFSIVGDTPPVTVANDAELIDFDERLRAEIAAFDAPMPNPPAMPPAPATVSDLTFESPQAPAPAAAAPRAFTRDLSDLEQRISGLSLVDFDDPSQSAVKPTGETAATGVVLIEAGLGGPDPVRQLLAAIPAGFPAQVLVRLHLQGGRYDRLVAQMARAASLPVALAEAGEGAAPRTIYFLPEGISVTVDEAGLIFVADSAPPSALYAALPAGNCAAVFLSGSDPVLADIAMSAVAGGALVLAQAPDDCYDGTACAELRTRGVVCALPAELAGRLSTRWPS